METKQGQEQKGMTYGEYKKMLKERTSILELEVMMLELTIRKNQAEEYLRKNIQPPVEMHPDDKLTDNDEKIPDNIVEMKQGTEVDGVGKL